MNEQVLYNVQSLLFVVWFLTGYCLLKLLECIIHDTEWFKVRYKTEVFFKKEIPKINRQEKLRQETQHKTHTHLSSNAHLYTYKHTPNINHASISYTASKTHT